MNPLTNQGRQLMTHSRINHNVFEYDTRILIRTITLMCIYILSWNLQTFVYMHYNIGIDSLFLCLFFAGMAAVYFYTRPQPKLKRFGIRRQYFFSSILESLIWTAGFCAIAALFLYYDSPKPLNWSLKIEPSHVPSALIYLPFSFVQEFIIRGVLQTTLYSIYGKRHLWLAIVVSNLIFACAHVTFFGFTHASLIMIPGMMWGYMYYRKPNLAGVTLSHTLCGIFVFDMLHLQFIPTKYCIYSLV